MEENSSSKKLLITAIKVKGNCPVYKVGDKTVIEGPEINLNESDKVCVHTMSCLGNFIVALGEGLNPQLFGLAKENNKKAYFQCLDPGEPYTNGGTVIFEVKQVPLKS